jgi:hypothetical protein
MNGMHGGVKSPLTLAPATVTVPTFAPAMSKNEMVWPEAWMAPMIELAVVAPPVNVTEADATTFPTIGVAAESMNVSV